MHDVRAPDPIQDQVHDVPNRALDLKEVARGGDSREVTVEDQHLAEQVQRVVGTLGMVEAIELYAHYEAQAKQIGSAGDAHGSKGQDDEGGHRS